MSTPCEEIRPELEALLASLSDGTLDAAAKKRLCQILREHPDARQFYLDYCQMHALLQSAHGVLQAFQSPSTLRRRRVLAIAAAAAALLLAAGVVVLRQTSRVDATVALVEGTAWIVRNGERVALPPTGEMRPGDRVATSSDSRTEVRLRDGSRILLLEQTDAEIGPRITLKEGTVRCDIQPQSRPLVFQTPHAEATVLGTSFELTAAWKETRLRTTSGLVRLSADGRSADVGAGQVAVANGQGVTRWTPVCDLDFTKMKELPPQMTPMFCASEVIHKVDRKIVLDPGRVTLTDKGLRVGSDSAQNGLVDLRWKDDVGEDLIVEVEVAAGPKWGLAVALSGNGFEGYRVFFAAIDNYPNGIAIDTIWPAECIVLARDPRPISYDRDHTLRVERRGQRIRVWIDGQSRIDTEVTHPLAESRRRVFSLCNFGSAPTVRSLKVWKAAAP